MVASNQLRSVAQLKLVQICDPHSGEKAKTGEEEVMETQNDQTYPIFHFGTGDLSSWIEGIRTAGIIGRVTVDVKGFLSGKTICR